MRQLVKGIAALTLTLGLLVGVPALLVELIGWPLPTRLPNLDEISLAFRSGINPDLLINTLAVVCWIFWAQLAIAIAVETIAVIRGRTAQRLRLMAGLQPAAARLVATVTLIAASLTPIRPAVAAPAPPVVVAVTPHEHHVSSPPMTPIQPSLPETAATEQKEPTGQVYVTQRLDTWWRIAETHLGDGRQWRQLRAHNIGAATPDGETITATTEHIPVGTRLHVLDSNIPASNTSPRSSTVRNQVTVVSGDNFWTIAANALTDTWGRTPTDAETADYWQQLIETNRHRLQPPHDPDLIYPGQTFHLPPIPADPQTVDHANDSLEVGLVVVEDGDSFWTIAATTLTDTWGRTPTDAETADYWQQLIEANRHRLQPPYDPDLIYPGQTFQLPPVPGATTQPADTDTQRPTSPSPSVPADAADPALQPAPVEPPLAREPETSFEPVQTDPPEPSQVSPVRDTLADVASDAPTEEETDNPGLLPTAAPLAGLGVLAAGVVLLINRLRSIQIRRRQPNTVPTPPPEETRQTENILRAAAAPAAAELVDLALRSLANHATQTPRPQPQVVGVHIEPTQLRFLLATPNHHPPEEWTVDDDGRSWILPTDIDTTHLHLTADTTPAPYPTLITIGHTTTSQLLFNLEHAGATRVTGPADQVQAALESMAVELASSHIADTLDIVCVGFGRHLDHLERIRVVQTIDGLLPSLESQTAALAAQGRTTPFEGRLAAWGGDSWTPTVILDPRPNPPAGADRILAAAYAGLAVVAVVGYPTGGHYQLEINENTVTLQPMGRTYNRRDLTPIETSHIAAITKTAKNLDGSPPSEPESDPQPSSLVSKEPGLQIEPDRLLLFDGIEYDVIEPADIAPAPDADPKDLPSDTTATASPSPSATPVVRVLGPIHVDGPTAEPLRPRSLEIVTFLAVHPDGVDTDRLTEAIWPDQAPISSRLNNAVFRARTQFGTSPAGDPYLPHGLNGFYQLHPDITTDLHQLHHHIDEAKKATNRSNAADNLQKALELVQGPPFTGVHSGYGWVHTEGHSTHTIVAVDNTAHQLAEYALGRIQPDLATWASRQGLLASWSCEECYRNLMKAALLRNDYTAFDAIYAELTALVDADQGPDENGWLDPETADLYEKHRRGRKPDS